MASKKLLVLVQVPRRVVVHPLEEEEETGKEKKEEQAHLVRAKGSVRHVHILTREEIEREDAAAAADGPAPAPAPAPAPPAPALALAPGHAPALSVSSMDSAAAARQTTVEHADGRRSVDVERTLEAILTRARTDGIVSVPPVLTLSTDRTRCQATAVVAQGRAQTLLDRLERIGIGSVFGLVGVQRLENVHQPVLLGGEGGKGRGPAAEEAAEPAAVSLRVEQVVEQIRDAATFGFDYGALVVLASVLAGVGLATDNTVVIVASMLVSPIMGPCMAATFGTVVSDWELARLGLVSEALSLAVCVLIGTLIGVACAFIAGVEDAWPTEEMASRGEPLGLLIGLAVAVPSGVGVALSVLGNNTSSLVGVAISASLLPPAVGAGMEWGYASAMRNLRGRDVDARLYNHMGLVSLALTAMNIGSIYVAALCTYKFKEVAPLQNKSPFWEFEVKQHRNIRTIKDAAEAERLKRMLQRELDGAGGAWAGAPASTPSLHIYDSFATHGTRRRRGGGGAGASGGSGGEGGGAVALMELFAGEEKAEKAGKAEKA